MLDSRTEPSRFSNRPLYLQVRDALAGRIAAGDWKPTAAIPNEGDLAREFGVSPGTMRKALDLLEAERLLTRRQGRGTFINDQASEELAVRYSNIRGQDGTHLSDDVQVLDMSEEDANDSECIRLRLRLHARVHRIRRVRFSEGSPYMLEEIAMPATLFPGLTERSAVSHRIVVLAQEYGILLGKGEERVTICSASPEAVETLRVTPGTSLLRLDRLVCTLDGRPAEWRIGQCQMAGKYFMAELN